MSELVVNSENPRFDPVRNQKEAINIMLEKEGRKIKRLTKDIVTNGINPLENFAVIIRGGKYVVLEGNRRVVALKLLDDPSEAKDQKLREFFASMKEKALVKLPDTISCTVFESEDDAHHWIKLKHTGENAGAGTVSWNSIQQDNFLKKASRRVQVFEFAKQNDIDSKGVATTNLERLIGTPYVCAKIGISFPRGELRLDKPKTEVKANLRKVFDKVSESGFTVGRIYKSEQRKSWINETVGTAVKTAKKATATSSTDTASNDESVSTSQDPQPGTQRGPPKSSSRRHLIPDSCELIIPESRINDIFRELKEDLILDGSSKSTPNAIGALFRVFLELSLDYYVDKKQISMSAKRAKRENSSYKPYPTIDDKVRSVSDYMEEKGIAAKHELNGIRRLVQSQDTDILNIRKFHEFVHSPKVYPEDLKSKWNNLQSFFELLWFDLDKKRRR